jgi:hypothetical protein
MQADMAMDVYALVKNWLAEPFKPEMSAWEIVALTGLVMIAAFLWSRVIDHILE